MRIVYSAGLGRLVSDSELQESNEKSSSVWERRIWTEKGRLTAGYIIMIACDHDGIITRCEIMQGLSFLAKFKPLNEFLGKDMKGRSIYEFLDDMKDFDKKQKRNIKVISMHLKHLTRGFRIQSLKKIRKKQSVRKHRMH